MNKIIEFKDVEKFAELPKHVKKALKNVTRNISVQRMKMDTATLKQYIEENPEERAFIISMQMMGVMLYSHRYGMQEMATDEKPIVLA